MVVSLLWADGTSTTTPNSVHTVGTYPTSAYGTNPFVVQAVAGLGSTPNGGSLVESGRWGPSAVILGSHYRSVASPAPAKFDGSRNATDFWGFDASFEDEGHSGYLNTGGDAIYGGDSAAQLCGLAFILAIDDVLLDGLGVVPPSVDGQAFASLSNPGAIVGYSPLGFGVNTWAVHSVSGVISNDTGLFGAPIPVRNNLGREAWPFAFALVQGHSNDTPPYATPDLVGGLPSWSMIGFRQVSTHFVAAALWVPADPSNPDYSFNFSGFPTSDLGNLTIYTLNFPPAPPSHPYAAMIG